MGFTQRRIPTLSLSLSLCTLKAAPVYVQEVNNPIRQESNLMMGMLEGIFTRTNFKYMSCPKGRLDGTVPIIHGSKLKINPQGLVRGFIYHAEAYSALGHCIEGTCIMSN